MDSQLYGDMVVAGLPVRSNKKLTGVLKVFIFTTSKEGLSKDVSLKAIQGLIENNGASAVVV